MESSQSENPKGNEEKSARNKELTFKLDEPVTTALNISPLSNVNEDESLSFIVLGKDSLEAQASLLASYVDIQQKSMSIVRTLQFHFISRLIYFEMGNGSISPCRITSR